MNLLNFFESVYRLRRLQGCSQNTTRLYRFSITNFGRTLGRPATLDDLTDDNLAKHMQRMADDGAKAPTINKDRAQLLCIWRYACRKNYVTIWPDILPLPEPERIPVAWMPNELQRIFSEVAKMDGEYFGIPERLWWKSILMACLETGERIGAVFKIQWHNLRGDWLYVPAEDRKGKRKDRVYQLTPATVALLQQTHRASTMKELLFPWPYSATYRYYKLGGILDAAGLENNSKTKFHCLRKTLASVANAHGLSAQKILGHANARTTERYIDPRFEKLESNPSEILAAWLSQPTIPHSDERKLG